MCFIETDNLTRSGGLVHVQEVAVPHAYKPASLGAQTKNTNNKVGQAGSG